MELVKKCNAIIRGLLSRIVYKLFVRKIAVGNRFARFSRVNIIVGRNSRILAGDNLILLENATISAVNGGNLQIGSNVGIGQNNIIKCQSSIMIGSGTLFGPNVFIYDHDHKFSKENGVYRKQFTVAPVTIGKNCWIGANTVILKETSIGDNCVIGAGSVVKGVIPSGTIFVQKR